MVHNTEKLRELLERCERLEGGRDLNFEGDLLRELFGQDLSEWPAQYRGLSQAPTASVDASIDLLEWTLPGWSLQLFWGEGMRYPLAKMGRSYPTNLVESSEHRTMPLAIILCALRALISQAEGEGA